MLEKANGDLAQATWATIHAAWACDDSGDDELAKKCRIKAVELIKDAGPIGQKISGQTDADIAITIDLLRRAGQFDEALQMIEQKEDEIIYEIFRKILESQKDLILRSDDQCHTISETMG